jgi:hypothetical protein
MIVAIIGNWTGTILAYLKQNMKRIEAGTLLTDEPAVGETSTPEQK